VRTGRRFHYDRSEDDENDPNATLYTKTVKRVLGPSRHFAFLYNTFVFLQLFNQINARKLTNEINIFQGMFNNLTAVIIFVVEIILQVIITEFTGRVFSVNKKGLTWQQWLISIAFCLGSWIVRAFLTLFDFKTLPEVGKKRSIIPKRSLMRGSSRIISERLPGMRSIKSND